MSEGRRKDTGMSGAQELREQLKEEMIGGTFKALLLFDIDELKRINVQEGIEAGDKVLSLTEDFLEDKGWQGFRTGGDEFGLIVRSSDAGFSGEMFHPEIVQFLTKERWV